ncbi:MAG: metal-dependent transcriptional regulator [Clostridiaceae bacterium]|jgi:Mn-dependent DtxR family transcriptional regulator|nr:metal-dependent transcriptional regulator [Clostridiaceae bacterium]
MATKRKLSPSNEDYLEKILELSQRGEAVRSVDIASHLHVSKAGVYKAVGVLREAGLIAQAHYGQIYLTEQGRQRAANIMQRHRMLKRFLIEILGLDAETAEQDACRMEHAISEETRSHWIEWLHQVLPDP